MDKGSCVVDKRSSMVENRGCVVNNRGSFNNRSILDNWSSLNHRGRSNERSSSIVEAVVVSVGEAIVIPKRVRVSNQRVIINKGAVSLTMSSNTAVVVSIGISLGIGISFGFSVTTFTGNNGGAGRSKSSRWKSSCKSSLQGATSCCDTVTGSQANNRGNWGNGSNRSNMLDKRGSMMDKRGSMKKRSSWGNKGSSSRKGKASVKEQLRISLSLTLMKTVDRLIAGTRKRSSIARCIVWSVQASIAIGSIVVQGISFRLSQAERGYGENYDHALHNVYRTAVLRRVPM